MSSLLYELHLGHMENAHIRDPDKGDHGQSDKGQGHKGIAVGVFADGTEGREQRFLSCDDLLQRKIAHKPSDGQGKLR